MQWRAALFLGITGFSSLTLCLSQTALSKPPIETKAATAPTEKAKSAEPRAPRLPAYYGQIGISDKQRLDLKNVQISYEARLEKLRNELKGLVQERDEKLENLLTSDQKMRLQELREAAQEKTRQRRAAAARK